MAKKKAAKATARRRAPAKRKPAKKAVASPPVVAEVIAETVAIPAPPNMVKIARWDTGALIAEVEAANVREAVIKLTQKGVSLSSANLYGASLDGANLDGANLYGANLALANLTRANLARANLTRASLDGASLDGASLDGANLYGANLYGANLYGANLDGANLDGANLDGANLTRASLTPLDSARRSIVPAEGAFIGWKKCRDNVLVKLSIPADAKRSNATGRKCRAQFADVLEIVGADSAKSIHDSTFVYKAGDRVTPKSWGEDRWVECGGGIHFYISRIEAENHDQ